MNGPTMCRPRGVAPDLLLEDITFEAAGVRIIDDVTLSIGAGEIVCLLGASGCGKTTLLRIAAGLERQTSGRVLMGERLVAGPKVFVEPDRRGVGLMFQDYALFPHLTVLGNVMFGLGALQSGEAREMARREIDRVGLTAHADDYPHMLSGGEQQRVALARAMVPNPSVLLMDEPFSNLDQRMRERIREETVALVRERKTTAVMVTHDPVEAMAVADRITLMRAGRLVQSGTPAELYFQPKSLYAARFLCDMNEVAGDCSGGVVECALGTFAAPGVADGPAVVCIRPQSIAITPVGEGRAARIRSARCLGETVRLTVDVGGLAGPLSVSLPARSAALPDAGPVGLKIDERSVLVFASCGDDAMRSAARAEAERALGGSTRDGLMQVQ